MTDRQAGDVPRRRFLTAAGGTALALGLAGCSGGDGGDGGDGGATDGGGGGDGGTGTDGGGNGDGDTGDASDGGGEGGEPTGEAESTVDGIEIADTTAVEAQDVEHRADGQFGAVITLRNGGDAELTLQDYKYQLDLYDADDEPIEIEAFSPTTEDYTVQPGETGDMTLWPPDGIDFEDVGRFEAQVYCTEYSDGVYCE